MRGPVNPSLNYDVGLLIEGFDASPYFMMTYNPSYYPKLFEDYGFQKAEDLYAYIGRLDMLDDDKSKKFPRMAQMVIDRFNVKVRIMDKTRMKDEVRMFLDIYNQALPGTWGFVPLSEGELDKLAHGMKHLLIPELTRIAEVDGKPVGVTIGLMDYNPLIKEINGRLFPFGFLKIIRKRKFIRRGRLISTNVLPEYQRWGLGLVLLADMIPLTLQYGMEEVEFSWVLESNHLSRASLEKGGAQRSKTYRIYDWTPASETGEASPE